MTDEWYAPREINFSPEQVLWLISYLPLLKEGLYPPSPHASGYTDALSSRRSRRHNAYFETPCQLAGEVEVRLSRCHRDGLLVEARYLWDKDDEYLCRCFDLTERELGRCIGRAIRYISGWKRKRRSYREFISHRRGREN